MWWRDVPNVESRSATSFLDTLIGYAITHPRITADVVWLAPLLLIYVSLYATTAHYKITLPWPVQVVWIVAVILLSKLEGKFRRKGNFV